MSRTSATLFVRPLEGRVVRKPGGALLKLEGEAVEASTYWTRRLDDQDVTDKPLPKARQSAPAEKD